MNPSRILKPIRYLVLLLAAVGGLTGCSNTPGIYTMPSQDIEQIRSQLDSVGVVVATYPAEGDILRPAKGPLLGAGRGFVIGAALPPAVGFVTPIPFGSVLGLFFSPVTAAVGSVYGAVTAVPAHEVAEAEAAIAQAAANTRAMDLRHDFMDYLIALGSHRTDLTFAIFDDIGPADPQDEPSYDKMVEISGVDAILEIRAERFGLRGLFTIDPPSSSFIEVRVRLILRSDNRVLFDEVYNCSSERELKYAVWARHGGQLIVDESFACATELPEKIIDDFFLVFPIKDW